MYKVILQFHDEKTLRLMQPGDTADWTDEDRIKKAVERGLIEEIKEPKKEPEAEEKPKAKAKKK